jgi:hypothetical protein
MRYTLLYILLSAMSLLRKSWVVPPTLGPPIHLCVMTQVQVPCLNLDASSSFFPWGMMHCEEERTLERVLRAPYVCSVK